MQKRENSLLNIYEDFQRSFGIEIRKKERKPLPTFAAPDNTDGALFTRYSGGLFYSTILDLNRQASAYGNEVHLIDRYRDMEQYAEVENAVDEIINELVVVDEENNPVQLILDNVNLKETTKKRVLDEWNHVLRLFHFKKSGYDIAKRFYVDGRIFYHLMIDFEHPEAGIQEVRYIDPRMIKKVIEPKLPKTEAEKARGKELQAARQYIQPEYDEYYYYNESGINNMAASGLKIAADSIAYAHSGLFDFKSGIIMSHMHKALKPFNLLRMLEDAFVIYKLSRAPERRIFYIDVSNLPPAVAEKYLQTVADRYKNKIAYDANTGEITNERMHMTMLQDFFLAQREGKGTQIDTLGGGNSDFTDMNQVDYHLKKLYRALNIPISRIEDSGPFNMGRPSEITRDEVKFNKFIRRLRNRFVVLFEKTLEVQLVLTKVMSKEEFAEIREDIRYDFLQDNLFTELKNIDMWTGRISLLGSVQPFTALEGGGYFSKQWVKRNILMMTEDEIIQIEKQIEDELPDEPQQANPYGAPGAAGAPSPPIPTPHGPGSSYSDLLGSREVPPGPMLRDDAVAGSHTDDGYASDFKIPRDRIKRRLPLGEELFDTRQPGHTRTRRPR